ncbi:MAG TPA: kelch repeat-containing protein [Chloroflexota bacterium]|nr:kelch repeat-containing protein [Chloroflexota bacterium]
MILTLAAALAVLPTAASAAGAATANLAAPSECQRMEEMGLSRALIDQIDPATCSPTLAKMPTARSSFGVVATGNGRVFAVGGWSPHAKPIVTEYEPFTIGRWDPSALATVEEFDPKANKWTTKASMLTARTGVGVAEGFDGKIYAIGGYSPERGYLNTVEAYDPVENTWVKRASMPTPRYAPGVVRAINGKILAFGGYSEDYDEYGNTTGRYHVTVEEYDPIEDSWSRRTDMPTGRYGMGAVSGADGLVYAIGGFNLHKATFKFQELDAVTGMLETFTGHSPRLAYLTTVESYDPTTDVWEVQPSMSYGRTGLVAVRSAFGDLDFDPWVTRKILAIGGEGRDGVAVATVEEFDLVTKTWRTLANLSTARANLGAALDQTNYKRIFVIGGVHPELGHLATVEEIALR